MKLTNHKAASKFAMQTIKTRLTQLVLSLTLAVSAQAEVLQMVPFQGRLHSGDNTPVENGRYNIRFSLYDAAVGGTVKWTESHDGVSVIQGYTNVLLGTVNNFDQNKTFFDNPLYIGISINGGAELFPRQQLIPSFHAVNATKLGGLDANAYALQNDVTPINTNLTELTERVNSVFDSALTQTEQDEQGNVIYKSKLAVNSDNAANATNATNATNAANAALLNNNAPSFYTDVNNLTGTSKISNSFLPDATENEKGISKTSEFSKNKNGYYWDKNTGFLIQWGTKYTNWTDPYDKRISGIISVDFQIEFTTIFHVSASGVTGLELVGEFVNSRQSQKLPVYVDSVGISERNFKVEYNPGQGAFAASFSWQAIGYKAP